jgi:DNA-binding transcriptional MerR regulator
MAQVPISEVSRATGFSSSALRYYERIGLLSPVGRSAGGYRVYDDRAVERLQFIARAKRLGLNLDEITDLVALWEDGPCGPVQARLRALVDEKVEFLDSQIDELARFRAQLAQLQRSLTSAEPADRCGPGCGCDTELQDSSDVVPIFFGRLASSPDDARIVCTLSADGAPQRMAEWQSVLAHAEERRTVPVGVSLRFAADPALLGELAALATREVECCSFFTFDLKLDAQAAWLTVGAPAAARPLVVELFGPPRD